MSSVKGPSKETDTKRAQAVIPHSAVTASAAPSPKEIPCTTWLTATLSPSFQTKGSFAWCPMSIWAILAVLRMASVGAYRTALGRMCCFENEGTGLEKTLRTLQILFPSDSHVFQSRLEILYPHGSVVCPKFIESASRFARVYECPSRSQVVIRSVVEMAVKWEKPFDAAHTKIAFFWSKTIGQPVEVEMMQRKNSFEWYVEADGAQWLELKFRRCKCPHPEVVFGFCLPAVDSPTGPVTLIDARERAGKFEEFSKLDSVELERVSVPKFKLHSSFDLRAEFIKAHPTLAPFFSVHEGFKGLSQQSALQCDAFTHIVDFKIDEVGVVAQSSSAFRGGFGAPPKPKPSFVADRTVGFYVRFRNDVLFKGQFDGESARPAPTEYLLTLGVPKKKIFRRSYGPILENPMSGYL